MKHYREIDKNFVWERLIAGKRVVAIVFESQYFKSGAHHLRSWNVSEINKLMEEEEVVYFGRVEDTE